MRVRNVEIVRSVERPKLLLGEGNPRRNRSHVPVDVPVCLLASKAEDVQTLRGDNPCEGSSNPPDYPLKREVFVFCKIGGHVLPVFPRGNEGVAVKSRVLAQKGYRKLVLVKDVMGKLGIAADDFTNEATSGYPAPNFFVVKRNPPGHFFGWLPRPPFRS